MMGTVEVKAKTTTQNKQGRKIIYFFHQILRADCGTAENFQLKPADYSLIKDLTESPFSRVLKRFVLPEESKNEMIQSNC